MRRVYWFAILLGSVVSAAATPVRVWQGTLTLPTYQEGMPDANPPFDLLETLRFNYPYTLRENLTNERVNQSWRAIYLENEYLKCSVLPDLGGHLYTCIDKLSGQPMFYANPSIKKAEIGYRGAWAAFGIEFNFPVSHNWVSLSPVDFAYGRHSDGSASITVGNIDRVYGMQWAVELVLRPRSTVLEERVTLSNRSDVRHRFYWWNNAGVRVWDDSRVAYPMRYVASHGFTEVRPWPVDASGKDLSVIANQTDGPVSFFAHGTREPYMAIWHPHTDTGVAHFADDAELPGKKIWSWGVDADGLDWRKALSDDGSAYVEVQGGLFRNQETYAFLQPRQTIRFSEYWMPIRQLGGIARANLTGALNLTRDGSSLVALFNANEDIKQAQMRVLDGSRVLLEGRADLSPAETWKKKVSIADPGHRYTFELADASGRILLRHTEGEYDWTPENEIHTGPQPTHTVPAANARTEGDCLELGKNDELNGALLEALESYRDALKKCPESFELRKAAGRLAASLLQYERAIHYLSPLADRDTTDPEVAYYLAIGYEGSGDDRNARAMYERAHRFPEFRAAAALQLGEMEARAGRLSRAAELIEISVASAPDDLRAGEELVALRDAMGQKDTANRLAKEWLARAPYSNFLREELGDADLAHLGADTNRVLDIAAEYMRLGLYGAASRVLSRTYPQSPAQESEPGAVLPQQHALVAYFNAYCREKLNEPAADAYRAASRSSTVYVFPAGAEAYAVLRAAIRNNDSDSTAHYLLGTLLLSQGETDLALQHWSKAKQLDPTMRIVDADMGRALLHWKSEPDAALAAFHRGLGVDSNNTELYAGMDQALSLLNRPPGDRIRELSRYPDLAHMPTGLLYELILNRAETADFGNASDLFRNRFFPRQEGGTNVRQVWVEVRLQQALSLAALGHCDAAQDLAGKIAGPVPGLAFTDDGLQPLLRGARAQYLLGIVHFRCGNQAEASSHFTAAMQQTAPTEVFWAYAAGRKLNGRDSAGWSQKLQFAWGRMNETSQTGWYISPWVYNRALLEGALGETEQANADFVRALVLSDRSMAHHLTRLARAQLIPE